MRASTYGVHQMRIEGRYSEERNYWAISIPGLALFTQGKSKEGAFQMVLDAVRDLLGDPEFQAEIEDLGGGRFHFVAGDGAVLTALVLGRGRMADSMVRGN